MGLINPDEYTAQNGVSLANTYVKIGTHSVNFSVQRIGFDSPPLTYTATTDMLIYKDHEAYKNNLQALESRQVTYSVPDPSAVYNLLYGSACLTEKWGNAYQFSATTDSPATKAPDTSTKDGQETSPTTGQETSPTTGQETSPTTGQETSPTTGSPTTGQETSPTTGQETSSTTARDDDPKP